VAAVMYMPGVELVVAMRSQLSLSRLCMGCLRVRNCPTSFPYTSLQEDGLTQAGTGPAKALAAMNRTPLT
jgi:hypothetical protein